SGHAISSLLPRDMPRLQGRYQASLALDGPLDGLAVRAAIDPPKGRVRLTATANLISRTLSGQISAADLDPAAAIVGAPAGKADLDAAVTLGRVRERLTYEVILRRLGVTLRGAEGRSPLLA